LTEAESDGMALGAVQEVVGASRVPERGRVIGGVKEWGGRVERPGEGGV